jgi:hypothetical protein
MSQLQREQILLQFAGRQMSMEGAATSLANLNKGVAETSAADIAVDFHDPQRAIVEYIRRAFPGIEKVSRRRVTIHLSKLDGLDAGVRKALRTVGGDDDGRAEALRAFQEMFGSGLPRRSKTDSEGVAIVDNCARREGESVRKSALRRPAKKSRSKSTSRKTSPMSSISHDRAKSLPDPTVPANAPAAPPIFKLLQNDINSTVPSSRRTDRSCRTRSAIGDGERKAIFEALDGAGESLGKTLLSVKSGLSGRRLEEIIPVLLNEGNLKQLGEGVTARYIRA